MARRDDPPVAITPAVPVAARTVAGIAGLAAVVFGVIAIFKNHEGASTAALLTQSGHSTS